MLAEGISTRRGRTGAMIHHDAVNRVLRPRKGARLTAITNGGYQLQYSKGDVKWKTDSRIETYFSNAAGQVLGPHDLFFAPREDVPLPDIVCRVNSNLQLRTQFYQLSGRWWHESKIEKP